MSVPPRGEALLGLLLVGAVLAVLIALSTPWSPLPGPVPGGRVAVDARADFSATEVAREKVYHRAVRPPAYLSIGLSLLACALLGLTPLGARLAGAAARPLGGGWVWQAMLGGIAAALVGRLFTLPFDARVEVVLRRYDLSTQRWPAWWADQARGLAISAALITVVGVGFYALVRAFPRHWWLPVAFGGAVFVLLASFLYPVVVEPIFNRLHRCRRGSCGPRCSTWPAPTRCRCATFSSPTPLGVRRPSTPTSPDMARPGAL